jgi:hypothetical protein
LSFKSILSLGVLEEDVEVVLRLAGWAHGSLREVDRAVGVRVGPRLLPPGRGRQDHVGEPGRLRREDVLDDDEEVLLLQDIPDAVQFREGDGGFGAGDPEELYREPCSA